MLNKLAAEKKYAFHVDDEFVHSYPQVLQPAAGADEAVDELIRRTSANQWATVMIDHDQQAPAIICVRSHEKRRCVP